MMKLPLQSVLSAAAVLALASCSSSKLHVTDASGDPIPGVRVKPVAVTYSCPDWRATNQCGNVCVPTGGPVVLEHHDFSSTQVDVSQTGTQHIVMDGQCNGK